MNKRRLVEKGSIADLAGTSLDELGELAKDQSSFGKGIALQGVLTVILLIILTNGYFNSNTSQPVDIITFIALSVIGVAVSYAIIVFLKKTKSLVKENSFPLAHTTMCVSIACGVFGWFFNRTLLNVSLVCALVSFAILLTYGLFGSLLDEAKYQVRIKTALNWIKVASGIITIIGFVMKFA